MTTINIREQTPRLLPAARPVGPRQASASGMTARDLLKIVHRRKWLIGLSLLIVLTLTFAGTLLWRLYGPIYTADAYVRVAPPSTSMMNIMYQPTQNEQIMERYKRGNANLAKSPSVLAAALKDEDLRKTPWFSRYFTPDLRKATEELIDKIQVSPMPETDFVRISMSGVATNDDDRLKGQLPVIVNAVAQAFIKEANSLTDKQREASISVLSEQKDSLSRQLRELQDKIAQQRRITPVPPGTNNQTDELTVRVQELIRKKIEQENNQSLAATNMDQIRQEQEAGALASNSRVIEAMEMDPTLRSLENAETSIAAELAAVYSGTGPIGPDHRTVVALESRRRAVREQIDQRKTEIAKEQGDALYEMYRGIWSGATQQLADLQEQLNLTTTTRREQNNALFTIQAMEDQEKDLQKQLSDASSRLLDMRVTADDETGKPASMRQSATVPLQPTWPRWVIMVPLGVLMGLLVGFGLAFLLEFIDTSVKTPTDITRRVDMPLLAMVPHADDLTEEIDDFRMACLTAPHSMVTEAYRELRTNLLFSGPASQRRSILVTSPSPDDGRTSVATSLAIAMANSGRRVVLVDANFRRPAIRGLFKEAGEAGFSNALSGQAKWEECIHAHNDSVPNLWVMSSGPLPPNPNELLGGELAKTVLGEMTAKFDQVIIDGPPLLLISDASVLASQVDGVVLVVRAGVNTYGIVQRCRDTLARIGAHTLGVVLNGVRTTVGGYLRKNYETFYEYHNTKS